MLACAWFSHHLARRSACLLQAGVRGPSGQAASRAEEKGADNSACKVFTKHEPRSTNHGLCGRSVHRGCARDARQDRKPPRGTAAPADKSLLASLEFPTISRQYPLFPGKKYASEPVSTHRPPFSVGFTASAVSWEFPGLCGEPGVRGRPSGPHRPPPSHGLPVHDCSPLFAIVRHCSAKN